jgi:hypothetical protein
VAALEPGFLDVILEAPAAQIYSQGYPASLCPDACATATVLLYLIDGTRLSEQCRDSALVKFKSVVRFAAHPVFAPIYARIVDEGQYDYFVENAARTLLSIEQPEGTSSEWRGRYARMRTSGLDRACGRVLHSFVRRNDAFFVDQALVFLAAEADRSALDAVASSMASMFVKGASSLQGPVVAFAERGLPSPGRAMLLSRLLKSKSLSTDSRRQWWRGQLVQMGDSDDMEVLLVVAEFLATDNMAGDSEMIDRMLRNCDAVPSPGQETQDLKRLLLEAAARND